MGTGWSNFSVISTIEKSEKTVQSMADWVRKRGCYSILLLPPGPQTILHFYNALDVSSPKLKLIDKNKYFSKSEKTSGQTIQLIKIKTVALLYLIMAA